MSLPGVYPASTDRFRVLLKAVLLLGLVLMLSAVVLGGRRPTDGLVTPVGAALGADAGLHADSGITGVRVGEQHG
jgi:hypothetical protein